MATRGSKESVGEDAGKSKRSPKERKPRTPKASPEQTRREKQAEMVEKAIDSFGKVLDEPGVKPTIGDFIKLIGIQKELEPDEPTEIKVTWVEPNETESGSEE
jgi:hypothetical protein